MGRRRAGGGGQQKSRHASCTHANTYIPQGAVHTASRCWWSYPPPPKNHTHCRNELDTQQHWLYSKLYPDRHDRVKTPTPETRPRLTRRLNLLCRRVKRARHSFPNESRAINLWTSQSSTFLPNGRKPIFLKDRPPVILPSPPQALLARAFLENPTNFFPPVTGTNR